MINIKYIKDLKMYIKIRKIGRDYWGECPFHKNHGKSLMVTRFRGGAVTCMKCSYSSNIYFFIKRLKYEQENEIIRAENALFFAMLPAKKELKKYYKTLKQESIFNNYYYVITKI